MHITMMWQFTLTGVLLVGNKPLVDFIFITTGNNGIWESGNSFFFSEKVPWVPAIARNITFLKTFRGSALRRKHKSMNDILRSSISAELQN